MSTQESLQWDADQDEIMSDHDNADHDDPLQFCDDCDYCQTTIEEDIQKGIRCEHGEYIPYMKNEDGYFYTDQECIQCSIDYGVAFESFWLDTLGRAKI